MTIAIRIFILGIYCLTGCTAARPSNTQLSLAQHYDKWCAFMVEEAPEWQFVPTPTAAGLPIATAYAEGLYYQHRDATLLILCLPKTGTLAETAQYHLSNLAHDYTSFAIISKESFQFHHTPAMWFLYHGVRKHETQTRQGYVIFADRGQTGLMISVTAMTSDESLYSPAFRSGVGLITLRSSAN